MASGSGVIVPRPPLGGYFNGEGTQYVGNFEYKSAININGFINIRKDTLLRIHNSEGYVDGPDALNTLRRYNYCRKDYLGNNREVWHAEYKRAIVEGLIRKLKVIPAETIQRTQYYPSGLPWAEGEDAALQPYKAEGKEFIEMHGLNMYDSKARMYDPLRMQTTTPDPLLEKYYSISPYVWCANNPVKYIDPDGRDVLIWYQAENGKMSSFRYHGGDISHNNSYVNKVVKALNYNISNGAEPSRVAVNSRDITVNIYETTGRQTSQNNTTYIGILF